MAEIRVAIADDHANVRDALSRYFSSFSDILVVGTAGDAEEALRLVRATHVDVLILDVNMPGPTGIEALPRLRAAAPGICVIVLSGYPAERCAGRALAAGARAYLSKLGDPADIVAEIRSAAGR